MNNQCFGNGVYGQNLKGSFRENPDLWNGYQNELAISRGYIPKCMACMPKQRIHAKEQKASQFHLSRNALLVSCLTLPFAAGIAYAEDSSCFYDQSFLFQLLDIPDYPLNNLIEIAAITGVTAETVHNEASSQLSGRPSQQASWIDPMPSKSRIGRYDYNKPSKHELNKIILELGSNRQIYTKNQDSLQANLVIKNNGLGQIDIDYAEVYAEGFGKPELRLSGCRDSLVKGTECKYKWELPLSDKPTYGIVNLTLAYGYSAEISTNIASLKIGPLELYKHLPASEDIKNRVGKVNYKLDIYNRGKGNMTINSIKGIDLQGRDYNIASIAIGTYLSGEKRSFNITASKTESEEWRNGLRSLKIEFRYEDAFSREIDLRPD